MSVLPEPVAPEPQLVRKVARDLAVCRGELTKYEEDPASALITYKEHREFQDACGQLAEHLTLLGVPEDKWPELADEEST